VVGGSHEVDTSGASDRAGQNVLSSRNIERGISGETISLESTLLRGPVDKAMEHRGVSHHANDFIDPCDPRRRASG
jgi:hypothetical protein